MAEASQVKSGERVALKETCRVAGGAVPLWPWHRARLAGAGVPLAALDAAEQAVHRAAAAWAGAPTRRARLTLVVAPDGTADVQVAQTLSSLDVVGGPIAVRIDTAEQPPLPNLPGKPADRSWWDAAHRQAEALGAHQAVLVAADGTIIDGSTAAVWIVEGETLFTPPAPPAIPSVSVAFIRDHAARAGLDIRVEQITWERFEAADEAMLSNAFGGAVAVRGRGGAMGARMAELFAEVWQG